MLIWTTLSMKKEKKDILSVEENFKHFSIILYLTKAINTVQLNTHTKKIIKLIYDVNFMIPQLRTIWENTGGWAEQ